MSALQFGHVTVTVGFAVQIVKRLRFERPSAHLAVRVDSRSADAVIVLITSVLSAQCSVLSSQYSVPSAQCSVLILSAVLSAVLITSVLSAHTQCSYDCAASPTQYFYFPHVGAGLRSPYGPGGWRPVCARRLGGTHNLIANDVFVFSTPPIASERIPIRTTSQGTTD